MCKPQSYTDPPIKLRRIVASVRSRSRCPASRFAQSGRDTRFGRREASGSASALHRDARTLGESMYTRTFLAIAAIAALAACSDDKVTAPPPPPPGPQATVVTATGNIAAKVDEFRNLLGPSNGGTAGE